MPVLDVETRLRCWIEDAVGVTEGDEDASASFRHVAHAARAAVAGGGLEPERGAAVVADLFDALIARRRLPRTPEARPEWLWMLPFGGGGAPLDVPAAGRAWAPKLTIDLGSREVTLVHVVSWEGGMTMRWRIGTRWQGSSSGGVDDVRRALGGSVSDDRGRRYDARAARSSRSRTGDAIDHVTDFASGLDVHAKELTCTVEGISLTAAVPRPAPLDTFEVRRGSTEEALEAVLLGELGALYTGFEPRHARRHRAAAVVGLLAGVDGASWMRRFDEAVAHAASSEVACPDRWCAVARGYERAPASGDAVGLVSGMAAGRVGGAVVVVGPLSMERGRLSVRLWTDLAPTRWGYALGEEPLAPGVELRGRDGQRLVAGQTSFRHDMHRSSFDVALTPPVEPGAHSFSGRLEVAIGNEIGSIPVELAGLR